jgi:ferredoxin-NADP reductase/DMSO/TMAO reductase YedYZ heme-binding membrane subunit
MPAWISMSTTEDRVISPRFAKWVVIANGLVPMALLGWDAWHGELGANDVNFAIHTTGVIGLILLVLSLAITPLHRVARSPVIIAVRRNLGVLAFVYLVAHFAIFFAFDRSASVASTLHEIATRVYLWFGTFALIAMIPLALTSTDRMVSRLGGRRWKALHRLAYPIAIASVVHYYLLVKSDTRQPIAFAAVIGALLLARVVVRRRKRPVRNFWSGELAVVKVAAETHDIKTFRLALPGGGALPFAHTAGQYLNLTLPISDRVVRRSYTISSSPAHRDYCEISVKRAVAGTASHFLHDHIREGSVLRVSAPAGRFIFPHTAPRCVLIAGGVGITPMIATVRTLTERAWPGEIYLVFSVRLEADIAFRAELEALQARFANLHVCITLTGEPAPAWAGARGHITADLLRGFIPDLHAGPVLLCGPDAMMTALRRLLVDELGLPDADVLEEAFVSPPSPTAATADALTADVLATTDAPHAPAAIQFDRAGITLEAPGSQTVLEAAEASGIDIPFECRSGICGQCKTRLLAGKVTMPIQDALTPADRANRVILACQAHPVGPIIVDA